MSIVLEKSKVTSIQVVHLQAPGIMLDLEPENPIPPLQTGRRLSSSCKALPVSQLRVIMEKNLKNTTNILIKQPKLVLWSVVVEEGRNDRS